MYAAEHDAIINYYKPVIRKNFLIGLLLAVLALVLVFVAVCLLFSMHSGESKKGSVIIVLLILASVSSSIMGKFMTKRKAARRAMNHELDQLEFARKQASISN